MPEVGAGLTQGLASADSSIPLYMQIQTYLVDQIRSGNLTPGEQVPTEVALAAQFGVSRMTARKAVESLAAKGMLTRHKGRGSFVSENPMAYGFSTMLSFSNTFRARGYDVRTVVLFKGSVPAESDVAKKLGLEVASRLLIIRRLRVIERRPAAIHTSYLDYNVFAELMGVDLGTESLRSAMEQILSQKIAYTNDSVQAGLSGPGDAALLEIPEGHPTLNVRGVAFTQVGKAIRFTRAVYIGSLFRFTVINRADSASILEFSSELGGEG